MIMSIKEIDIVDASGKSMTLLEKNGNIYPVFTKDIIDNISTVKFREDDVLICAYPKSGTHWIFEICRMLLSGTTDVEVIRKENLMIEKASQIELDAAVSPRLLNTHVRFNNLPTDFFIKKSKIIFINRNPKDVAVSLYFHTCAFRKYTGEFRDFLHLFLDGKVIYNAWYDYELDWERVRTDNTDLNMLNLMYEDLKQNPISEIRRMSDFLGLPRKEVFFKEINEACDFSKMKKRHGHLDLDDNDCPIMYRKGEVGDWKNWFTVAESDWFDELYKERMAASKLKFRYF